MNKLTSVEGKRVSAPTRCDYCARPPAAWFVRYEPYVRCGRPRVHELKYAACSEHETCVNWQGHLASHPDVKVLRTDEDVAK